MKKWKAIISAFALAMCASVTAVGLGGWVIQGSGDAQYDKYYDTNAKKVAYTQDSKGVNTYFTTVESALENTSSGNVYVIPGSNPTITSDCTVKSGVSLILPYADDFKKTHDYLLEKGNNGNGFADKDSTNLVTRMTLDNITMTLQGTLILGGVNGSVGVQSVVSGKYTEVLFKDSNIKAESTGRILCYGFIKEEKRNKESIIDFSYGSYIESFLGIYDYSTATSLLNAKDNGVFPLKQFDCPHIRTKMIFHYGSKFYGKIHTYGTNAGDMNTTPALIDKTGAFVCMTSSDAVITWKYSDESQSSTSDKFVTHKTEITMEGTSYFGSLKVSIKKFITVEIDSKDFYLPVPFGYSIKLLSGTNFTVPNTITGIKFMPGSSLRVEEGAKVSFNTNTIFYQNCTATDGTNFSYPSKNPASFINNGNIEINGGFDGLISVDKAIEDSAQILTGTNFGLPVDSKEGDSKSVYSWGGGHAKLAIKTYDSSVSEGFYYKSRGVNKIVKEKSYSNKVLYGSNDLGWYDVSNIDVSYGINVVANLNDSTNPNGAENLRFVKNGNAVELIPLSANDPTKYSFGGYYFDSTCSLQPLAYDSTSNTYKLEPATAEQYVDGSGYVTIFGKWKEIQNGLYTINTIMKKQSSNKMSLEDNAPSIVTKPVGDLLEMENLSSHKLYYYSGINSAACTGTLRLATFNGYKITLENENGEIVKVINVDVNGNSADATIVQNFVLKDTNLIKKDYVVTIVEEVKVVEKQYTLSLSSSSNSTIEQGKTVTLSVSDTDSFVQNDIALNCMWSCADAKVGLTKEGLKATALNNYSAKTLNPFKTETKDVIIKASVYDGNVLLASLQKTINVRSIAFGA